MCSSKAEEFSLKDTELLVDSKKQPWFKRAHVGKCLGLVYIYRSTAKREDEDQKTRVFLQAKQGCHSKTGWSGPKDQQNNMNNFLSPTSAPYVIVNSRKDKGTVPKVHLL